MGWPMSQDYNEAIQAPARNFSDPDLRRGEAVVNALGLPAPCSGNFADVVLLGNDLLKFVQTVQVARRCRRIIWFNFAGTLAVDSLGMGLAAVGMLNPLFAAFIHVSSELAFILNSARLLPGVSKR